MEHNELLTLRALAKILTLPTAWLKSEAQAGRIPHLKVGRRLFFNADAVRRELVSRAANVERDTAVRDE